MHNLPSSARNRHLRWSMTAVTAVGILTLGSFSGRVSSNMFLDVARAQSQFEEDVHQKFKSLIDQLHHNELPKGIAKSNGRVEATQIDVAAKYPGRLTSVTVNEGDEVTAGQTVGRLSSPEYEAQLRGAQSEVLRAKRALAEADALIAQRKSDQVLAKKDLERGQELVGKGWMSRQVFDQRVDRADSADANLRAAEEQREVANFAIQTAQAEVERIDAILVDLTLLSPRSGRVQYLIHRAGEVVNAGTRILTVLDLNDVYMTIYLPETEAGQLALGDEARMILDAYPQDVIPATVSFVATDAQFTPKSVETADERQKLIFRIKLQVDPKVLNKYHTEVKTGMRGIGFVRTGSAAAWPDNLAVKLRNGG